VQLALSYYTIKEDKFFALQIEVHLRSILLLLLDQAINTLLAAVEAASQI
jgi:hypothetical protein